MSDRSANMPTPGSSRKKHLVATLGVIVAIVATAVCTYYWQHRQVVTLKERSVSLQSELSAKNKPTKSNDKKKPTTFTHKSFGMTLTLPTTYGLIVSVEGNKGGAPGATYRVASVKDVHTLTDAAYEGVRIDIDAFANLDQSVAAEKYRLNNPLSTDRSLDRDINVTDVTVAKLPAKLLTTEGLDEYEGNVAIYIVGSGGFQYTITANGRDLDNPSNMLSTVLKGMSIKPYSI
jgi:hypothetical protein